ncbi:MAG: hypothetical protein AB7S26_29165 [Sandaracinaceae bacterium]
MSQRGQRVRRAIAVLALVAAPATAHAQLDAPSSDTVVVTLGHPSLSGIEPVIDELLARHGVTARHRRSERIDLGEVVRRPDPTPEPTQLGYAWIDRPSPTELAIYIADAAVDRILVRSIGLESGEVDEIARETAAHILEATVEALQQGVPIGRPRAEVLRELGVEPTPEAATDPVAVAPIAGPSPSGMILGLGVGYAMRAWTESFAAHGPSILLELRAGDDVRGGARVEGGLSIPNGWRANEAGADFVGGGAWLDGLLDIRFATGVYFACALGVGVELSSVTPTVGGDRTIQLRDPFLVASVLTRGSIGLLFHPPSLPIAIRIDAGVVVDPTDLRFVVETPDGTARVLDPWLAQPGGRVSLFWQP